MQNRQSSFQTHNLRAFLKIPLWDLQESKAKCSWALFFCQMFDRFLESAEGFFDPIHDVKQMVSDPPFRQARPYSQILALRWIYMVSIPLNMSLLHLYHSHQFDYRLGIQIVGSYGGVILQQSNQDSFRYVGSAVPCSSSFCPGLTIGIHTPNSYPRQSTISDHPKNAANLMKS